MTEEKVLTDGELKMKVLCTQLHNFKPQLQRAREAMAASEMDIENLGPMIARLAIKIKELERSGVTRYEVKDIEKPEGAAPAQSPAA